MSATTLDAPVTITLPGATIAVPAGNVVISGGTVEISPVPVASPPIPMPSGIAPGATITLGTGPDQIALYLYCGGSVTECQFGVLVNGVAVAGTNAEPITITGTAAAGQLLEINGDFGEAIPTIELGSLGVGTNGLSCTIGYYNGQVLANNDAMNSQGGANVNAISWEVTNGLALITLGAAVQIAPPAPGAEPSVISVTIGGTEDSGTFSALVVLLGAKGTMTLPAKAEIIGTGAVPAGATVDGAGATLNATGLAVTDDRGVLVLGAGAHVQGFTVTGGTISEVLGNNAAGLTNAAPGDAISAQTMTFTGNQDGVRTEGGNVTLTTCTTRGNGAGDGLSHELYFSSATSSASPDVIVLNQHTSECGPLSTHALKTRSANTQVNGGLFMSGGNTDGNISGSVVDCSYAGQFKMQGGTLVLAAGSANNWFYGHGLELAAPTPGGNVTFAGVVFSDETGTGGQIVCGPNATGATLDVTGSTYTGSMAPAISGPWAAVVGTIAKAA